MPKKTLRLDEELFVKALARAVEEGDSHFVDGHAARLDALVEKVRALLVDLSQLQGRTHQLQVGSRHQDGQYVFSSPPVSVS